MVVFTAGKPPLYASKVEDLNLAVKLKHWTTYTEEIENPHDMPCDECHEGSSPATVDGSKMAAVDTLTLCRSCHGDSSIHPVNISPVELDITGSEMWLPLGKGVNEGKVVCLTCHYIHNTRYYANILRGDDITDQRQRESLCSVCHGSQLIHKSPHQSSSKSCSFCHTKFPKAGDAYEEILKVDIQNRCNFCHDTLDEGHYLAVNPFSDPDLKNRDTDIPLFMGRFTCISCHDPHARKTRRLKMLRPDYLQLASTSNRINPHWKDMMCISCHEREPAVNDPALKFDGNITLLCNRCHDGVIARNDVHPVDKPPTDKVAIPDTMPLLNGNLTCETCHDSSLQEGGEKKTSTGRTNPKFLRDGFVTRNEFCFRCHIQEQYGKLNAHNQVDKTGSIIEQSCLFCHSSLPDIEVAGTVNEEFDIDSIDDYCTVCHMMSEYRDEHPVGDHLVEPSREVLEAIDSSLERIGVILPLFNDRITCATCHNPHQEGVIRIKAAARGAGTRGRLRLEAGRWQCIGCNLEKCGGR